MEACDGGPLGDDRGLAALGKVKILSSLSDADMEALYRRADLVALPTRGEGWGRPHVEAMASGTPIVATNWSGPTAYLDASVGFPLAWTGLEPVGEGPFASTRRAARTRPTWRRFSPRPSPTPRAMKELGAAARRRMVERYAPAVLAAEVQASQADTRGGRGAAGGGGGTVVRRICLASRTYPGGLRVPDSRGAKGEAGRAAASASRDSRPSPL